MSPTLALVPRPTKVALRPGFYELDENTGLSGSPRASALVRELLGPATGFGFPDGPGIALDIVDSTALGAEGYRLSVTASGVTAEGSETGLLWAVQTLRQLLPPKIYSSQSARIPWRIPCVEIADFPSSGWRGSLLDVARWFQPIDFLYRYVDLMAVHKLNRLHLHLTDDQGWRFEVHDHPRLTQVGSVRRQSQVGQIPKHFDGRPHGGFYTQEQLRGLVAYACRRGVDVMPEIDVPGHAQAAIAAYPHLGNDPANPPSVRTEWGISPNILNVSDESVRFVSEVLDEVVDVFPFEYVHVGGDEVLVDEWQASGAARERLDREGLHRFEDLQGWWNGEIVRHLARHGRRAAFWDEVLDRNPPAGALIFAWQEESRVAAARAAGFDVVAAASPFTYFDWAESASPREPAATGLIPTPLAKVYGYRPGNVSGLSGQLWTECLPTPELIEYRAYPRLAAIAETGWSCRRDYEDFAPRLRAHLRRLDILGVHYRPLD